MDLYWDWKSKFDFNFVFESKWNGIIVTGIKRVFLVDLVITAKVRNKSGEWKNKMNKTWRLLSALRQRVSRNKIRDENWCPNSYAVIKAVMIPGSQSENN